jgi:anti-sigma B factor antagonist
MTVPTRQQVPLPQLLSHGRGGVTVVSLRGELDFLSVPALWACLSDIRWRGRPLCVIDLSGLAFIDCACLGVLVTYSQEIRAQGGSFALAGPRGAVRRVLSVTGLITRFEVHDTVGQAAAGRRRPLILAAAPGWSPILRRGRRFGPGPAQSAIGAVQRDLIGVTGPTSTRHANPQLPPLPEA